MPVDQERGSRTFNTWYFKTVDPAERHIWALMPGVCLDRRPGASFCFVRVLDGVTGRCVTHEYPMDQFWSSRRGFDIVCGHSRFAGTQVQLHMDGPDLCLTGDLQFAHLPQWPVGPWLHAPRGRVSPPVPLLEASHRVLSPDAHITGSLVMDGEDIDFTGGHAYIESDVPTQVAGSSVWVQSNHFDEPDMSLVASLSEVPVAGQLLTRIVVALVAGERVYRWTTWNGSRLTHLMADDRHAEFTVTNGVRTLEVWAGGGALAPRVLAPRPGVEARVLVHELDATVQVRLVAGSRAGRVVVVDARGRHAGLEVAGDMVLLSGRAQPECFSARPAQ